MIAFLLALPFLVQEDEAAAKRVLEACAAKMRECPAVSLESNTLSPASYPGDPRKAIVRRIVMKRPGLLRIETQDSGLLVMDGRGVTRTFEHRDRQEYSRYRLSDPYALGLIPEDPVIAFYLGSRFQDAFEFPDDLKVAKGKHLDEECDVVSGTFRIVPGPGDPDRAKRFRIWIGTDRWPRKYEREEQGGNIPSVDTTTYSKLDPGAAPGADAFTFTPRETAIDRTKARTLKDVSGTPEAQKAQAVLVEVHKGLHAGASLRYERKESMEREGKDLGGQIRPGRTSLARPGRVRMDSVDRGELPSFIIDGETRIYIDSHRRQVLAAEPQGGDYLTDETRSRDPVLALFFQEGAPLLLAGATDISTQTVQLDGEDCTLVEWTPGKHKEKHRLWIGPDSKVRRSAQSMGSYTYNPSDGTSGYKVTGWMTATYRAFDSDPKFPADYFAFTPPPGWRDQRQETPPSLGSPAPDFSAPDREGKTVRLADFKGKPLALAFLGEDPGYYGSIQKLQDELAPKGIAVTAIYTGREKPPYDPAKHRFRFLTPSDDLIERAYAVPHETGFVLIDSSGKIYFVAMFPNSDFRAFRAAAKRVR